MSDNHEPFSRSRRLTRVIVAITNNAKGKVRVSDDFVFLVRQIINEHVIMPVQDEGKIEPVSRFLGIGEAEFHLSEIPDIRRPDKIIARVPVDLTGLGKEPENGAVAAEETAVPDFRVRDKGTRNQIIRCGVKGYGIKAGLADDIAAIIGTPALAAKFFFPKVIYKKQGAGLKDTLFIVLGILVGEILLFLVAHYYISLFREGHSVPVSQMPDMPHILTNPLFIAIILTALAAGSYFFDFWLDRKRPSQPGPISFTSGRKSVSLSLDEILYIESNDDVTTVIATGGRRFKNYTPISRWEAILSPHFIRIHRSYLVNPVAVTRVDVDLLYIDNIQLPISKKYKDAGHAGALLRARGGEK